MSTKFYQVDPKVCSCLPCFEKNTILLCSALNIKFSCFLLNYHRNKIKMSTFKAGFHISRKDCKHMTAYTFFKISRMPCPSHSRNDRKYSYFTRNICNRCVDSLKIFFGASSEAYSVNDYMETRLLYVFSI